MDREEDQARQHRTSPPNTFGVCWDHGGSREDGHRKLVAAVMEEVEGW